MRTLLCVLMLLATSQYVSADDAANGNAVPGDKEVIENKTLVVTVFDKPLYLEDLTPLEAEVKREELPQAEFDEWLRLFRGARTYDNIRAAVTRRYIEREKLDVTKEEFAAVIASVETIGRNTIDSPRPPAIPAGIRTTGNCQISS